MDVDPKKLRQIREAAFLTQVELSLKADLTEMTVSRLERGIGKARIRTVRRLADALGTAPASLLATSEEKGQRS